ncbi:MAG: CBS domain-containing protein [Clostridia bacterium]|nr:CBS domain-containing protein [Clostridia bacterium]
MKVSEIMTKNMVVVNSDDTILDAAKLMKQHNIGCIPVIENGDKVLGVITDRDIVLNMAKYNSDPANTCAKEIASDVVYKVKPDVDVKYALDLMQKQKIRRLVVIENESLVGIVSLGDIAVHTNRNIEVGDTLIEISKPSKVENI